jgi:hypothetical protein
MDKNFTKEDYKAATRGATHLESPFAAETRVGSEAMEVGNDCEQNQWIVVGSQHKGAAAKILVTVLTTSETAYERSNPLLPETTQAGRQRRCMKWTDEINIFVMMAYYRITNLENDSTAYRDQPYG